MLTEFAGEGFEPGLLNQAELGIWGLCHFKSYLQAIIKMKVLYER